MPGAVLVLGPAPVLGSVELGLQLLITWWRGRTCGSDLYVYVCMYGS